ncbi:flagellar FliJ family protein [Vallicoccus soli]|uniref:Flagellar FliJ protein n=1 Tax=Vallicoccus soli TaxID=2339232 RepID=A0A3A3ZCV2_9ACTN|nr:flagellar FliJ family protein [Vallicoccus soli]RJK92814.1 flagellar export protein FliJ [Vallicoccus soli]
MPRRNALAAVLRVRKVQEEVASAEVALARAEAEKARATLRRFEDRLESPVTATGSAHWAGIMAARTSLAAEAAAARALVGEADGVVSERLGAWAEARAARRGVERLAERQAAALRAEQERREQLAVDDRTGADHHRRTRETW